MPQDPKEQTKPGQDVKTSGSSIVKDDAARASAAVETKTKKTSETAAASKAKADVVVPGKTAGKTKTAKTIKTAKTGGSADEKRTVTKKTDKDKMASVSKKKGVRKKSRSTAVVKNELKPAHSEEETAKTGAETTLEKSAAAERENVAAAKEAAAAAREAARAKRQATRHSAPIGSIYASAVQEGSLIPDILELRNSSAGGIYAAAVQSGAVQREPDGAERSSIALAAGGAPPEVPAEELVEEDSDGAEDGAGQATSPTEVQQGQEAAENLVNTATLPTFGRQGQPAPKKKKKSGKPLKMPKKQTTFGRGVTRVLSFPPLRAIGGFLYQLGFSAECYILQAWRLVRNTVVFLARLLAWAVVGICRGIGKFFSGLAQDFAQPFTRQRDGKKAEKDGGAEGAGTEEKRRGFTGLVGHMGNVVLPVAAMLVMVFVVGSVVSTNYALAVSVQGEVIGYIVDETVLEDAKAMLRGRLRLAGDQNMEDWKFDSMMTLARTNNITSKDQLVNAMLRNSAVDIVEGTGLYVDNELVAVTTDGERLREYLDNMLEQGKDPSMPEAVVSFVKDVQCDPSLDDVFLEASVKGYDELVEELSETVSDEVIYTAKEGDTLQAIADANDLVLETLLARNPQLGEQDGDYEPDAGEELLIQRAQPYLQVQSTLRQTYTETIPFPVVEQETDEKALGYRFVAQEGADGLQEVQDDLIYIEGELVDQVRVEEQTRVITPPVEQIVQVGTYDFSDREMRDYNPAYMWPVPDYTYSSRGMSGGHRGRDINGPEGTPIFAANAGVVITAGWHYSYGNHVVIQHPDGLITLYGHCSSLAVTAGDAVKQGQYIAAMGNTGFSFGNHLHLEFQRQGGGLLNPDDYVVAPHGYSM